MRYRKLAWIFVVCICILFALSRSCFAYSVFGYSFNDMEMDIKQLVSEDAEEEIDADSFETESTNSSEEEQEVKDRKLEGQDADQISQTNEYFDVEVDEETDFGKKPDDGDVEEDDSEIMSEEENAGAEIIEDKKETNDSAIPDTGDNTESKPEESITSDIYSGESAISDSPENEKPKEQMIDEKSSANEDKEESFLSISEQVCGEGLNWSYTEGVLTISGSGNMYDYSDADETPWTFCRDSIIRVVIEDGVTSIGKSAFSKCINLTDVSIPDSVTRIGECAFSECSALKEIELPTHMEAIEYRTFYMCTSLSRVTVKKDIKNHVHTPYVISGIDSTCTERGYTDATVCIDCGATIENSKPIAAKGHNWGRWVTTRAATVQQQGLMERTCTVCGEKESSVIARMHPVSIENAVVTGINEMTYTGTALKPSPTVSVRGEILKAGTDYTVTYSNNVDAGKNTAIIIITGKGNYTGTKRIPFTISRATQSITGLSASYTKTYGDKAFTLGAKAKTKLSFKSSKSTVVVVDAEGKVTIKGAGKATITVTAAATGNYNVATKTVTVTVSKASQSITGLKGTYKKTFGNKAFPLGAKAKTKRTYKTSNKMVATVDKKGQVTIKGAGTAKITITAAASANYKAAKKTVTVTVAKAAATVKATASKKALTLSSAKLAQKNLVVNPKITCSSKGSRSYENVSTNKAAKKLKVNKKTGKITVPKNTAKGTYSVKIKVTVKEKGNFKKTIKTLTVKVIVK